MEHAFPSRFELEFLSIGEVVVLCLAAFFAGSSLVGLCLTYRAKPSPKLVSVWFAVAVVSPLERWLAHGFFENNWRHSAGAAPWLNASFWTVLVVSIFGAILADIRLAKTGQQPLLSRLAIRTLRYGLYAVVVNCVFWFFTPTISEAPLPARRSQCKNNLKQIGIAMHNYHDIHTMFPAAQISTPPISWRVQLLPYIDQASLWEKYVLEEFWDSEANEPIAKTQIPTFNCPSRKHYNKDKDDRDRYYSDYTMLTGDRAFSGHNRSTRMRDIIDGASNTLAVVEATGLNIVWTEPRDAHTTQQRHAINYSGNEKYDSTGIASSWHKGGANVLFVDDTVKFLSENIDGDVLNALTTTNGQEEIPWSEIERR